MILQFNSTTGAWQFTKCDQNPPIVVTGTGTVSHANGCFSLLVASGGNRISANFTNGCLTGSASVTIQFSPGVYQTFTLRDSNINNNTCSTNPVVTVLSPIGGETLDAGSSFTISWTAVDSVGILGQDILYSTDGGNSFSAVVAGLGPAVSQYNWVVPSIASNKNVKIRVVTHDASCNTGSSDSASTFAISNPGITFSHQSEAPLYLLQGGFNSTVYVTNTSCNAVTAELVSHEPAAGNAAPNLPTQITLSPGGTSTLNVATLLAIGSPWGSTDPNVIKGSLRLRHNGGQDGDVSAMIAVDNGGMDTSFTTPFTYPASSQSSSGNMQSSQNTGSTNTLLCSPMFYIDNSTDTYVSVQNVTNSPVSVNLVYNYGTGASGTPNGSTSIAPFTVGPQQTFMTRVSAVAGSFQGAEWGSLNVIAPPQTVAAHAAAVSSFNHLAFSSCFRDWSTSSSTTKVLSTLKLDYNSNMNAYWMVCNVSSSNTVSLTAAYQTSNGVAIPSSQLTLGPGQQSLVTLNPRQILTAGGSTMADCRIALSGSSTGIVVGGCSMSPAANCAFAACSLEPNSGDNSHLESPFFTFDGRTSGIVQLSNLSSSPVQAGIRMGFADVTNTPVTTSMVTVPAGGTTTVDLLGYSDQVDDSIYYSRGSVEVMHGGPAGALTASFTTIGTGSNVAQSSALTSVPAACSNAVTLFPNTTTVRSNGTTDFNALTNGSGSATWGVSSTTGNPGTITPKQSSNPKVSTATYTPPPAPTDPGTVTVTATTPGGSGSATETEQDSTQLTISPANGRLDPDGGTPFSITAASSFPSGQLTVLFQQKGNSVTTTVTGGSATISGTAPPNSAYVSDVDIVKVFDSGGNRVFKKRNNGLYYAFDPPGPPTAVTPAGGFNRLGGNITITGTGFKTFPGRDPVCGGVPCVNLDGIGFTTNHNVTATMVNGDVQRADRGIQSCNIVGQSPCKSIIVRNPGARNADKGVSAIPLYILQAGPPPTPQFREPDSGYTIGGTLVTITGSNMDFTQSVSIGGPTIDLGINGPGAVTVLTTGHAASNNSTVTIFDIDNAAPAGTVLAGQFFTFFVTAPPVLIGPDIGSGFPASNSALFIVGPGETVIADGLNAPNAACLTFQVNVNTAPPPVQFPGATPYLVQVNITHDTCTSGTHYTGDVTFNVYNQANAMKKLSERYHYDFTQP